MAKLKLSIIVSLFLSTIMAVLAYNKEFVSAAAMLALLIICVSVIIKIRIINK